MNPATARRFPLVPRPRPVCQPLTQRVTDLHQRAVIAQDTGDIAAATAVFNLSALLASDCGIPDLARTWCHRLARAALGNDCDPRHALEPIVNLARLHVRAGNGPAAWTLLETLFRAIDTRTDAVIEGLTIPAARITNAPGTHADVRAWLWTVLLGTGAHALATAGQWAEASRQLTRYNGIGTRMLDGRQITVIAHATAGRDHQAHTILDATQPGEPWETAVTCCLRLLLTASNSLAGPADVALSAYYSLALPEPGLAVFRTRLGLALLDALGHSRPAAQQMAAELVRCAAGDGYAARDILSHSGCLNVASDEQIDLLNTLVEECGLGAEAIPEAHLAALTDALDIAESVIT